jgi:hypothetical protein
MATTRG